MKKYFLLAMSLMLFACAPVLNRDLMKEGLPNPSLSELRSSPEVFKGKLFILGGVIVETRFVQDGSQVEVYSLPVDSRGFIRNTDSSKGRFLALYPRDKGLLDPVIYKKGREVTLAGVFLETRKGKLDEMEYLYPVFEIRQIYLWEERRDYIGYPYYPNYYYPNPYWYTPYWGPWGPPPPGWWW